MSTKNSSFRFVFLSFLMLIAAIGLIVGCGGGGGGGGGSSVTVASIAGRILMPDNAGSIRTNINEELLSSERGSQLGVANAEVWIETLGIDNRYHARTDAEGYYVIKEVPYGQYNIISKIEGIDIMKNRSGEVEVSAKSSQAKVPDMPLLEAKNVVKGQLKDADGNFLPENTELTLWGEVFKVGKNGTFVSPPLPDKFTEADIQVLSPKISGKKSFTAPFVSDIVPAFMEVAIGSKSDGNHAPTVSLKATLNDKIVDKVTTGALVKFVAIGSDPDAADKNNLTIEWDATAGTFQNGATNFEKTWEAPDYDTIATITATVTDTKGATGIARVPLLVNITTLEQYVHTIDELDLTNLVAMPVAGEKPSTTIKSSQYNGEIKWYEEKDTTPFDGEFAIKKYYVAKITLSPKKGFTLTGIKAHSFEHRDSFDVLNEANSGEITILFNPIPGIKVTPLDLTAFVVSPVANTTAEILSFENDEFKFSYPIEWFEEGNIELGNYDKFREGVVYTVKIPLSAKENYTFEGVAVDGFTHDDAITTLTVSENLDNHADLTLVFNATPSSAKYNLTNQVVTPMFNNTPETKSIDYPGFTSGNISWFKSDGSLLNGETFKTTEIYTAKLTLEAKDGDSIENLNVGAFSHSNADEITFDYKTKELIIVFNRTLDAPVSIFDMAELIDAPSENHRSPKLTIANNSQYKLNDINWFESNGITEFAGNEFNLGTVYVAKAKLEPIIGYTFEGVDTTQYHHNNAKNVTFDSNSQMITITFNPIVKDITDFNLNSKIVAPIKLKTPTTNSIDGTEYTSTEVKWYEEDGVTLVNGEFARGRVYVAKTKLTAKNGYRFPREAESSFEHISATEIAFEINTGELVITFERTQVDVVKRVDFSKFFSEPVAGETPDPIVPVDTDQYIIESVKWFTENDNPLTGSFKGETVYKAVCKLAIKPGFTFEGANETTFTHDNSITDFDEAKSMVTFTFYETRPMTVDMLDVTDMVIRPLVGSTPINALSENEQFKVTSFKWYENLTTEMTGKFQEGKTYEAKLTLEEKAGYKLPGISDFNHSFADSTTLNISNGNLTVTFNNLNAKLVDALNLAEVIVCPYTGETPKTSKRSHEQYEISSLKWYESNGTTTVNGQFASNTVYILKCELSVKEPYTLYTLEENSFEHYKAEVTHSKATQEDNYTSVNLTIVFQRTKLVLEEIGNINGTTGGIAEIGSNISVGEVSPAGATADYQWQASYDGVTWKDITGETRTTYNVDFKKTTGSRFIRVAAKGTGAYENAVYSKPATLRFMPMIDIPSGIFSTSIGEVMNAKFELSPFEMGKYQITRSMFEAVMGHDPTPTGNSTGKLAPVSNVNWYQAITFCNKLSIAEGLTPVYTVSGVDFADITYNAVPTTSNESWNDVACNWDANGYRLPVSTEWAWAAMGADKTNPNQINATGYEKSHAGPIGTDVDECAWYQENSGGKTQEVGLKVANELGLYDITGNVAEWCWDKYKGWPTDGNHKDYRGGDSTSTSRIVMGNSYDTEKDKLNNISYLGFSSPVPFERANGLRVIRNK